MKRRLIACAFIAVLALSGPATVPVQAGTFIWSGITSTGWQGDVTPAFDGTEDFYLGKAINQKITLSGSPAMNSIYATSGDGYLIRSQCDNPLTLTINNGIFATAGAGGRLVFDSPITITGNSVTGNLAMDAGNSQIIVEGHIKDGSVPTNLTLATTSAGANGFFIFNNTGCGNDYTGDTTISSFNSATPVIVAFWNSTPFGSGTLYFDGGAALIAHGSGQTISNDIVINTTNNISLKSWDDTLKFTTCGNTITLNADATLVAQRAQQGYPDESNFGMYPLPGPMTRNPIVIAGDIGEGTSHSLTISGGGVMVLDGTNTYSFGTVVNGSLVFGNMSAIPASGSVTINASGYAGIADTTAGNFASFLSQVTDQAGMGAVGIDTFPGNPTSTLSDAIVLTGFAHPVRLGTATSAILTGNITPQGLATAPYLFGNGGGTLYVQSPLTGARSLTLNSSSTVPLTLYLQQAAGLFGGNTYSGVTTVNNGFLVFDGANSLVGGVNSLVANGAGSSYIGYTDAAGMPAVANFLTNFNHATTNGIIGFDAHSGSGTINISDPIDLSLFTNVSGVYLGTISGSGIDQTPGVILSGVITPTAGGVLRLTAANGGMLQINSSLGSGTQSPGVNSVSLGTSSPNDVYSNGTVFLNNANTYTGGTTINSTNGGLTVEVGTSSALGTGTLTLSNNVIAGLQASTYSINLPNPISLNPGSQLFITGSNDLQLSGAISGSGSITAVNPVEDPDLTLSGDNSGFSGDISLYNSYLYLDHNNAAGTGTIRFLNSSTGVEFTSNALNPVIYGLKDENHEGYLGLYYSNQLTINTSNSANDHDFGGSFDSDDDATASITVTSNSSNDPLYLHGHSTYFAGNFNIGTSNLDQTAVAIGTDDALGYGTVTLNTSLSGGFALNKGVTFTNPFVYNNGVLLGFGTFSPSAITENGMGTSVIKFDTGKGVVPGIFGLGNHNVPGTLTITSGVDFANGGAMLWSLQDANSTSGHSLLAVNGSDLNISATTGQFKIFLATLDGNGAPGIASLTGGFAYNIAIATTTGGSVLNFNAADFTIDTSMFQNTFIVSPFLTTDGTSIFVNFTAVPEPETYALMSLGLGAVLFPALRRRKRA